MRGSQMRQVEKPESSNTLLFAIVVTGIVIAGQLIAYPNSVRNIINGNFIEGLTVQYPAIYTLFAPVFQLADRLTMMSAKQLFIFLVYINVIWIVWRVSALVRNGVTIKAILAEVVRFIGINAFVPLCFFLSILVSRPLPSIDINDPDIIVLDFHTHTHHSWDGRPSASLLNQIQRRRSGGFDAFFITDHNNRYSALETEIMTAVEAGNLKPIPFVGEEISSKPFHLMVYGPDVSNIANNPDHKKAQDVLFRNRDNPETLVTATTDADWWKQPEESLDPYVLAGLNGFELAKASPKGLNLTVEDRKRMVSYALKNNLIITGASDNHGFGYTDYVWNLLRLPGWKSMNPGDLERAILQEVRQLGPGALTIVTRIKAEPTLNPFLMGIDPLRQIWEMLRSLPKAQAVIFVLYGWIPFIIRSSWRILRDRLVGRDTTLSSISGD